VEEWRNGVEGGGGDGLLGGLEKRDARNVVDRSTRPFFGERRAPPPFSLLFRH